MSDQPHGERNDWVHKIRFAGIALLGAVAIWAGVCCFGNPSANIRQDGTPVSAQHPGLSTASEEIVENTDAVLTESSAASPVPEGPATSAGSVCVMTGDGIQLAGKADTEFVSIASTTKIMTALLTLELGEGQLDEPFNVGDEVKVEGSALGIKPGAEVTLRLLVWGMLLSSGNDAAAAAAIRLAGRFEEFAVLMNERAKEIGMEHTVFVTPSGLDADGQGSCAKDLALLACEALQNPDFRDICEETNGHMTVGGVEYWMTNHNRLLKEYDGCIGIKTGFTDSAGRCLVSAAERDGAVIVSVVLHDPDDWADSKTLLDWGFSRLETRELVCNLSETTIPATPAEDAENTEQDAPLPAYTLRQRQKVSASLAPGEQLTEVITLVSSLPAGMPTGTTVGIVKWVDSRGTVRQWSAIETE